VTVVSTVVGEYLVAPSGIFKPKPSLIIVLLSFLMT
jgi:hypothetical protein